jgi:hypothetical protein
MVIGWADNAGHVSVPTVRRIAEHLGQIVGLHGEREAHRAAAVVGRKAVCQRPRFIAADHGFGEAQANLLRRRWDSVTL